MSRRILLFTLLIGGLPTSIAAQQHDSRAAIDLSAGYAAFLDESPIEHFTAGASWRWQLTHSISIGPELVYMRGPAADRDVFLTGKFVFDFRPGARVQPYVVADGGIMFHRSEFLPGPYWSRETAVSGGGGVRIRITGILYAGPEMRIGWEPHLRITGIVTWRPGRG